MYKKILLVFCTLPLLLSPLAAQEVAIPEWTQAKQMSRDMNKFGHILRHKLRNDEGNAIFSPYSIFTCLSMIYAGANGETAEQIERALHLSVSQDQVPLASYLLSQALQNSQQNFPIVKIANGVFVEQQVALNTSYQQTLDALYTAHTEEFDAHQPKQATDSINSWVEKNTEGKIFNLFHPSDITDESRLVLVNTLYFKGEWSSPFLRRNTMSKPFHVSFNKTVPVEMMEQVARFPYAENEQMQIVGLPIKSEGEDSYILWLFLPKLQRCGTCPPERDRGQIKELLHELSESLEQKQVVRVAIPQLLLRLRSVLNQPLSEMGMSLAFTNQADLSGISVEQNLCIDKIVHEVYFCMNEKGLTATGATGGIAIPTCIPHEPDYGLIPEFIADRPFSFVLTHTQTKVPLFMGRIQTPNPTPCN